MGAANECPPAECPGGRVPGGPVPTGTVPPRPAAPTRHSAPANQCLRDFSIIECPLFIFFYFSELSAVTMHLASSCHLICDNFISFPEYNVDSLLPASRLRLGELPGPVGGHHGAGGPGCHSLYGGQSQ